MLLQFRSGSRHTVLGRVVAAAVKRPMVVSEPPPDDSRAKLPGRAAQGDIRLALAKVAEVLAIVEVDDDLGMALVELTQHRRQQGYRENVLRRDPDRAARIALLGSRRFRECSGGHFHLAGTVDQLLTCGRRPGTRPARVGQREADPPPRLREGPGDRGPAYADVPCGLSPAAVTH